jgi:hypothetical protein
VTTIGRAARAALFAAFAWLALATPAAAQPAWPTDGQWIWLANDPEEGGLHNDQRDVESLWYYVRDGYLFLRMKNRGPAGWCTTCGQSREHARYKWLFDTVGNDGVLQGGTVRNTEYMLFTEDVDNNLVGEVTFIDRDPLGDYNTRWSTTNPPNYVTNTPVGAPFANYQRVIGAVDSVLVNPVPSIATTQYLGIPQFGTNTQIGYRVYGDSGAIGVPPDENSDGTPGPFVDGVYVDMYVNLSLLGSPSTLRLMWLTDQEDQNLDQAPCCDRPDDGNFIVIPLKATLTIEKDVPGGNAQDFGFTVTYAPPVGPPVPVDVFNLDDDADGTLPNTWNSGAQSPGNYTAVEGAVTGWTLGSLTCTNNNAYTSAFTTDTATRTATIALVAGSDVSCRFVNVQQVAGQITLTVVKDALPNDPQDFAFTLTGQAGFSLDDDADATLPNSRTFNLATGATYTLNETPVAGWSTTVQCTGGAGVVGTTATLANTLPSGSVVTCTYTNTKLATVVITKQSNEFTAGTFDFTTNLPGAGAFQLTNGAQEARTLVSPASYVVTESAEPGYVLQNIECVDSVGTSTFSTDLTTGAATLNLSPGANVLCTFVNGELGHLIIVKNAVPDGSASFAFEGGLGSFTLTDDGSAPGDCSTPSINSTCYDDIAPGDYPVRELVSAGWALTGISCTGGQYAVDLATAMVTPTVPPGGTVVCTFANQKSAPVTAQAIPTLGETATMLLGLLLALGALVHLQRRQVR